MSIPPQLIRVKRKRIEETPVTFLQFDDGVKRHRSGSNWVYQRRDRPTQPSRLESSPSIQNDAKPVIHVSKPNNEPETKKSAVQDGSLSPRKTLSPRPSQQRLQSARAEPRRFHLSRAMMKEGHGAQTPSSGVSKKGRSGPAVFVERSRKRLAQKALRGLGEPLTEGGTEQVALVDRTLEPEPQRKFKKPTTSRTKSPKPDDVPARAPLPASAAKPHEDMDKIAEDMNQWVLNEIGANLHEMEQERRQEEKHRFKPKAPAKRYMERHPEVATDNKPKETKPEKTITDVSDEEDDDSDWVIEEYVRIPANSMAVDVSPNDVGVLVLDGEEDDILFFGPEHDEEDDLLEDDEDENAENHYTADYPEDEVESDDEYGRHAYLYRTKNASDDEEFDNDLYSDNEDDMIMEGDDEDVTMARIKTYMRRNRGYE